MTISFHHSILLDITINFLVGISSSLVFVLVILRLFKPKIKISDYKSLEKKELVKNKNLINQNIKSEKFKVIDARSKERFLGKVPEPRKGLRSGNIENSLCIPFNECLNTNKTFKKKEDLQIIFKSCLGNIDEKNIVFSCGSGVTACVLALAYSLINDKYLPCIYDGSWAEYGMI